jgi:hypothetical protein
MRKSYIIHILYVVRYLFYLMFLKYVIKPCHLFLAGLIQKKKPHCMSSEDFTGYLLNLENNRIRKNEKKTFTY